MLLKIAISCLSIGSSLPTTAILIHNNISSKMNYDISRSALIEDIEKNKIYLGDTNKIKYDNKVFDSEGELKNYILDNNQIVTKKTSSNPDKIIKDYENNILDNTKIYDANFSNFKQLYRDAFGNVSFSRNDALNTYTNEGLVKPEYSYDGFYWFDSPEEAKINIKTNMKINKSLYYVFDNKYYNAFNKNDIDELVNQKFDNGLYVLKNKNLSNQDSAESKTIYGNERLTLNLLKKELKDDFTKNYYKKITSVANPTQSHQTLRVAPSGKSEIRVFYKGNRIDTNSGEFQDLTFATNFNGYNEMLKDFQKRDKWHEYSEGSPGIGRYFLERSFNLINPKGQKENVEVVIISSKWSAGFGKTDSPSLTRGYSYSDQTKGAIWLFKNQDFDLKNPASSLLSTTSTKNGVYSNDDLTNDDIDNFYETWYDYYFNNVVSNFGTKQNQDFSFDELKKGNLINALDVESNKKYLIGDVYKDKSYNINYEKGYSQSLIKSYYDWKPEKDRILKDEKTIIDNVELYKFRNNLFVTKEELDNFLPLQGNVDSRIMYSYGPEKNVSDRYGKMLSTTETEAKEREVSFLSGTLQKKYVAFDVFGNKSEGADSKQKAIDLLNNEIETNSKFVNKNEISSWEDNVKIDWNSIISDGVYNVYGIKNSNYNDQMIYFKSKDQAFNSIKKTLRISDKLYYETKKIFLYQYKNNNKVKKYIYYDFDYNEIVNKILKTKSL